MENKQRNTAVNSIIQEFENEFAKKSKDNPNTILVTEKFNQFMQLVDDKTRKLCSSQISEFEKYAKVEVVDGNVNIQKKAGNEKEADHALAELEKCQTPIASFYMAINMFSQYN